jgi:aldose 1-epimerase
VSTRFTAFITDTGGLEAISITDGSVQATIALAGATLLRWTARLNGREIELGDGYLNRAEFDSQNGVRNGLMLPFVNRIADGRYTFAGRAYDLLPGRLSKDRLMDHGSLRLMPLTLSDMRTADSAAQLDFVTSVEPDAIPDYRFSLGIRIRYVVTSHAIELCIQGSNTGPNIAPYAVGWHPYFRQDTDRVHELQVMIPARRVIRTHDLIPLDGADAFTSIAEQPQRGRSLRPGLLVPSAAPSTL